MYTANFTTYFHLATNNQLRLYVSLEECSLKMSDENHKCSNRKANNVNLTQTYQILKNSINILHTRLAKDKYSSDEEKQKDKESLRINFKLLPTIAKLTAGLDKHIEFTHLTCDNTPNENYKSAIHLFSRMAEAEAEKDAEAGAEKKIEFSLNNKTYPSLIEAIFDLNQETAIKAHSRLQDMQDTNYSPIGISFNMCVNRLTDPSHTCSSNQNQASIFIDKNKITQYLKSLLMQRMLKEPRYFTLPQGIIKDIELSFLQKKSIPLENRENLAQYILNRIEREEKMPILFPQIIQAIQENFNLENLSDAQEIAECLNDINFTTHFTNFICSKDKESNNIEEKFINLIKFLQLKYITMTLDNKPIDLGSTSSEHHASQGDKIPNIIYDINDYIQYRYSKGI